MIPGGNPPAAVESLHHQLPFESTATGMTTSVTPIPGGIATSFIAAGRSAHFGRFVLMASDRDIFTSPTTFVIEDGVGTLTLAGGDQLDITYHGTGTVTGVNSVTEVDITVTGGTGRFAGATGSLVSHQGVENVTTNAVTLPIEGVVTLHGHGDKDSSLD
jgi:hypothetical protein